MKKIIILLLLLGSALATLNAQTACTNRCLNFDGRDDYIQLPNSPVQGNVNFTIEGWFRSLDKDGLTNCPAGNFERIIGCGGSRLEIGECAGTFAAFIGSGGYKSSGIKTGDGKWHYFAVTKYRNAMRVYLDGNMAVAYNIPAGEAFSLDNTFRIGRWPGGGASAENWQGEIDEIRIWEAALPAEVLWENSTCKLNGTEPGLAAYYHFDQGAPSGKNTQIKSVLTDLTASHNNGALHGFAFIGSISNWICSEAPIGVFCDDSAKDSPLPVSPENNRLFQAGDAPLPDFSWKWNGVQPGPDGYHLGVFRHDAEGRKVIFGDDVTGKAVSPATVFGKGSPAPGIYEWRVTDTLSGRQSPPAFFTLTAAGCGNTAASLEIGDSDWSSGSLPVYPVSLIISNSSTAGCSATFSAILPPVNEGVITGITPSLPVTIAPGQSQVFSFAFTPAHLVQRNLIVLCLGNRQSPPGNTANLQINAALPSALYPDVAKGSVAANVTLVSPGTPAGVFNLSGNLTTTLPGPVSAVEFQVQSISFSATPPSCSGDMTSAETSGVFIYPGTTINGSNAILFAKETSSSPAASPVANNNTAKNIRWAGNLPARSTIPFQLSLGLPAVSPGQNAGCCKLSYQLRIRATVFYTDAKDPGIDRAYSMEFRKDFTN